MITNDRKSVTCELPATCTIAGTARTSSTANGHRRRHTSGTVIASTSTRAGTGDRPERLVNGGSERPNTTAASTASVTSGWPRVEPSTVSLAARSRFVIGLEANGGVVQVQPRPGSGVAPLEQHRRDRG